MGGDILLHERYKAPAGIAKRGSNLEDNKQSRLTLAPLDAAEVGTLNVRHESQRFL